MSLSNQEIDEKLIDLGTQLGSLGKRFEKCIESFEMKQSDYENALDRSYLTLKATKESATVKELECQSRADNHDSKMQLVMVEAEYKSIKNQIDVISAKIGILQSIIKFRTTEFKTLN